MIGELEKGAAIIQALCAHLTAEEARVKPDDTSWSVVEVICHLIDEEREDFREHLDQVLHRQNNAWHPIDPEGWVFARKYHQQDLSSKLVEFTQERECSLNWLRSLDAPNFKNKTRAPFGEISAGDLLASWVMHDTLHIRQLVEQRYEMIRVQSSPFTTRYAGEW
jgi:hypothetical protein